MTTFSYAEQQQGVGVIFARACSQRERETRVRNQTYRLCPRVEGTGSQFLCVSRTAATYPQHLRARPSSNRMALHDDEAIENWRRNNHQQECVHDTVITAIPEDRR
jgi:hypothetical protein